MPASSAPPPYESAVNQDGRPALNVTNPQGQTQKATSADQPGNLRRMQSSDSVSSVSTAGEYGGTLDDDERRSLDDAGRELPKGWVRCFDPKSVECPQGHREFKLRLG